MIIGLATLVKIKCKHEVFFCPPLLVADREDVLPKCAVVTVDAA